MAVKSANRYPLDFDALEKGDEISVTEQERIFGLNHNHPKFWSHSLNLKTKIEREMHRREVGACVATVFHRRGAIVIADDETAAPKSRRGTRLGFRKARRYHRKAMGVDLSKLSAEERVRHEKGLLVQGAMLAAVREKRSQLALSAAVRKTPAIGAGAGTGMEKGEGDGNGEAKKE